jgi:protein-tyrosine phosphatase
MMEHLMGFTDIHNHLLPDVDDGAGSLAETLRQLQAMASGGVVRLAFSPHYFVRTAEEPEAAELRLSALRQVYDDVVASIGSRDDVPRLFFGQEILLRSVAAARVALSLPGAGHAGTHYMLVEFGFDLPDTCTDVLRELLAAGRTPIVAHPERYRRNGSGVPIDEAREWKELGALLQVNVGSLLGLYSSTAGSLAWQLLAEGMADLVGSDNHGDSWPVTPADAERVLLERDGTEQAELLLAGNPERILADDATLAVPPLAVPAGGDR